MLGQVVEINEDGRHLSLFRGFMLVTVDKCEIARLALDEIAVIALSNFNYRFYRLLKLDVVLYFIRI